MDSTMIRFERQADFLIKRFFGHQKLMGLGWKCHRFYVTKLFCVTVYRYDSSKFGI